MLQILLQQTSLDVACLESVPPSSGSVTSRSSGILPLCTFYYWILLSHSRDRHEFQAGAVSFPLFGLLQGFLCLFSTIEFGAGQLFIMGDWLAHCRMFLAASLSSMHKMPLPSLTWDIPDRLQALPNVQNWNPLDNSDWLRACNSSWSNPSQL